MRLGERLKINGDRPLNFQLPLREREGCSLCVVAFGAEGGGGPKVHRCRRAGQVWRNVFGSPSDTRAAVAFNGCGDFSWRRCVQRFLVGVLSATHTGQTDGGKTKTKRALLAAGPQVESGDMWWSCRKLTSALTVLIATDA